MSWLAFIIYPLAGAFLARLGLVYGYTGCLIAYALTGNITVAIATYLSISLGNTVGEILNITGNPELIAVTNAGGYEVDLRLPARDLKMLLTVSIIKRVIAMLLCLFVVGYFVPRIPLGALPWFIYVVVFFLLIKWRESSTKVHQDPVGVGMYAMIALLCWLLAMYLTHIEAPISVGFISLSAIASVAGRYMGHGDLYEEYEVGNDSPIINWLEIGVATLLVWVIPGLTGGAAARTVFNKPNWLLGIGTIDVLLEGWTLGTWLHHGVLSGKTMLGASLQVWAFRGLTLGEVRYGAGAIFAMSIGSILIALVINLLIVQLLDPLYLTPTVQRYLPQIIVMPIMINLVVSIVNPFAIIAILAIAMLIAACSVTPSMRALAILFVTAG